MMDYEQYNILKETIKLEEYLRHDCMNIYKSLEDIHDEKVILELSDKFKVSNKYYENLVDTFSNKADFLKGKEDKIKVVSQGVVKSLETIFSQLNDDIKLYIPSDVYPIYLKLANEHHTNYETFNTFLRKDYKDLLDIKDSVILFTLPSKPIEFNVTYKEVKKLTSNGNVVILDTVYLRKDTYNIRKMANLENIIILNSLSKTFLQPKTIGFVYDTSNLDIKFKELDYGTQQYMNDRISRANTNELLYHLIEYGWKNQTYSKTVSYDSLKDSKGSYFKCIEGKFLDLLEDDRVLTIPLSVFNVEEKYSEKYVLITPLLWLSSYLAEISGKEKNECELK